MCAHRKYTRTILIVLLVCSASRMHGGECVIEPSRPEVAEISGEIRESGWMRLPYRQAVIGADWPGTYALAVYFHGINHRGTDNQRHLSDAYEPMIQYCLEHRIKAVLLFPQCPKRKFWTKLAPLSPALLLPITVPVPLVSAMRLIAEKTEEFAPSRIYLVGLSMGGYAVWDLLSRCPESFSAGLIVSGGGDPEQAERLVDIPIQVVHGTRDKVVPVSRARAMVKAIWDAGGERVVYREIPEVDHGIAERAFNDPVTWEWLFAQ